MESDRKSLDARRVIVLSIISLSANKF